MPAFSNANDQGQRPTMEELEGRDAFVKRHIGPTSRDLAKMLGVIGADSLDDLIDRTVPADIRLDEDLDLPSPSASRPHRTSCVRWRRPTVNSFR